MKINIFMIKIDNKSLTFMTETTWYNNENETNDTTCNTKEKEEKRSNKWNNRKKGRE